MTESSVKTKGRIVIATNAFEPAHGDGGAPPQSPGGYVHYSEETVAKVRSLLRSMGFDAEAVPFSEAGFQAFIAGAKAQGRPVDAVIDLFEPGAGACAIDTLPRVMNALGLPFSGSGLTSRLLQRDKDLSKKAARDINVLTPPWLRIADPAEVEDPADLDRLLPAIVKPNAASVSASLFLAETRQEAIAAIGKASALSGDDILVERFVPGTEVTVVKIGNGPDADVIPLILVWEMSSLPPSSFIFFQHDKLGQSPKGKRCNWRLAKSFLNADVCAELVRLTNRLGDRFDARDILRVDFRIDPDGDIHFIETNGQPNINTHRGSTAFTINREFYRSQNAFERRFVEAALARMGLAAAEPLAT